MTRLTAAITLSFLAVGGISSAEGPELKTEEDKVLYTVGLALSRNLATFRLTEAELEIVKAGLADGVFNRQEKVDFQTYQAKMREFAQGRAQAAAAEAKQEAQAYLAKVAEDEGVKKTESGMLIKTIAAGSGNSPAATDRVKVHYTGKLIDETVFDSSVQRGEPATFALNGVIRCWTEGLQLIKEGGKATLYCPSDIAYGDRGRPKIPPGATLVFDVELLEIVK